MEASLPMYGYAIAHYCDLFGERCGQPDAASAFVQRIAGGPCSVLDIGAGVGSTAFALAAAGFEVTALEPDAQMFAVLLARLALRKDLEAKLSPVARAAGFALGRSFDICTCFSVLHLLLEQEQRRRLVAYAAAHLAPGGRFVLEVPVHSPQRVERALSLAAERRFGDVRFQHDSSLERLEDGAWRTDWKFVASRNGEALEEVAQSFTWIACSAEEVHELLAAAGLVAENLYADFDGSTFVEAQSLVLVAVGRKLDGEVQAQ